MDKSNCPDKNPSSEHSKNRFNRRQLLASATAGISLSFSGVVGADEVIDYTQIPFLKRGDTVARWVEVPHKWWQQMQQARRSKKQLESQLEDRGQRGLHSIGIEAGESHFGELAMPRIVVAADTERRSDKIPNEANGIPVRTEKPPEVAGLGGICMNGGTPSNGLYAGRSVQAYDPDGTARGRGTHCSEIVLNGKFNGGLTAAHLWDNICDGGISIAESYVKFGDERIGEVIASDPNADYVAFDGDATDQYFKSWIKEKSDPSDSNQTRSIKGHVTREGASYLVSSSGVASQMGCCTGRTQGVVDRIDFTGWYWEFTSFPDCVNFEGEGIVTNAPFGDGDSGGPVYWIDEYGDGWILHMSSAYEGDDGSCDCGIGNRGWNVAGVSADQMNGDGLTFGFGYGGTNPG